MLQDNNETFGVKGQEQVPYDQMEIPGSPDDNVKSLPGYDWSKAENLYAHEEQQMAAEQAQTVADLASNRIDPTDLSMEDLFRLNLLNPDSKDPDVQNYFENQKRLSFITDEVKRRTTPLKRSELSAFNPFRYYGGEYTQAFRGDEGFLHNYAPHALDAVPFFSGFTQLERERRFADLMERQINDVKNNTVTLKPFELQELAVHLSLAENKSQADALETAGHIIPTSVAWGLEFAAINALTGGTGGLVKEAGKRVLGKAISEIPKRVGNVVWRSGLGGSRAATYGQYAKVLTQEMGRAGASGQILSFAGGHTQLNMERELNRHLHETEIVEEDGIIRLYHDENPDHRNTALQALAKGHMQASIEALTEGMGTLLKFVSTPMRVVGSAAVKQASNVAAKSGMQKLVPQALKDIAQHVTEKGARLAKATGEKLTNNIVAKAAMLHSVPEEVFEERLNDVFGYAGDQIVTGLVGGPETVDDMGVTQHLMPAIVNRLYGNDLTTEQIAAERQALAELMSFSVMSGGSAAVDALGRRAVNMFGKSSLTERELAEIQGTTARGLNLSKEEFVDIWGRGGSAWKEDNNGSSVRAVHNELAVYENYGDTIEAVENYIKETEEWIAEVDKQNAGKPSRTQVKKSSFYKSLGGKEGILRSFGRDAETRDQLEQAELKQMRELTVPQRQQVYQTEKATVERMKAVVTEAKERKEKLKEKALEVVNKIAEQNINTAVEITKQSGVEGLETTGRRFVPPETENQETVKEFVDELAREEVVSGLTGYEEVYTQQEAEIRSKFKKKYAAKISKKKEEIKQNWESSYERAAEIELAQEWVPDSYMKNLQNGRPELQGKVPEQGAKEDVDASGQQPAGQEVSVVKVSRAKDFKETRHNNVELSNGEIYTIFRDTEQFGTGVWHFTDESAERFGMKQSDFRRAAGIGFTRKEAEQYILENLPEQPTKKEQQKQKAIEPIKAGFQEEQMLIDFPEEQPFSKPAIKDRVQLEKKVASSLAQYTNESRRTREKEKGKEPGSEGQVSGDDIEKQFIPPNKLSKNERAMQDRLASIGIGVIYINSPDNLYGGLHLPSEYLEDKSNAIIVNKFNEAGESVWMQTMAHELVHAAELRFSDFSEETQKELEQELSSLKALIETRGSFEKMAYANLDEKHLEEESIARHLAASHLRSPTPAIELQKLLTGKDKTAWQKIVSAILQLFRKLGGAKLKAEKEIIEVLEKRYGQDAIDAAVKGKSPDASLPSDIMAAPPVDSKAFKDWFKKSEVVDEKGEPRVVYHGSKNQIKEFKARLPDGMFFFAKDPEFASRWPEGTGGIRELPEDMKAIRDELIEEEDLGHRFASEIWNPFLNRSDMEQRASVRVYPVYLSVQKLFDPRKHFQIAVDYYKENYGKTDPSKRSHVWNANDPKIVEHIKNGNYLILENKGLIDHITSLGFDGMVISEDSYPKPEFGTIAVWDNKKIKSASGNIGGFDPQSPNIMAAPPFLGKKKAGMPTQKGVLENAIKEINRKIKEGEQLPKSGDEFLQRIWGKTVEQVMRTQNKSGLLNKRVRNAEEFIESFELIFEDMFPVLITQNERKNFAGYYDTDAKVAKQALRKGLKSLFGKDFKITDDHWIAFQLFSGIFSPQTELKKNIEEALQMLYLFIEAGPKTVDDFIWMASDKQGVPALSKHHKQPFPVAGSSNGAKVRAAIVSVRLADPRLDSQINELLDHPQIKPHMDPKDISAIKRAKGMKKVKKIYEAKMTYSGDSQGFPYMKWALANLANTLQDRASFTPNKNKDAKHFGVLLDSIGYKSPSGTDLNVKEVVESATNQRERIPVGMMFGQKVGAYVLNGLGNREFITTDIWEARLARTFYKGMMSTTGVPANSNETKFFQDWAKNFTKYANQRIEAILKRLEDKKEITFVDNFNLNQQGRVDPVEVSYTGKQVREMLTDSEGKPIKYQNADLQAVRWFFTINLLRRANYQQARTDSTISGYTNDLLQKHARSLPESLIKASPPSGLPDKRSSQKLLSRSNESVVRGYREAALRRGGSEEGPGLLPEIMASNASKSKQQLPPRSATRIGWWSSDPTETNIHRSRANSSTSSLFIRPGESENLAGSAPHDFIMQDEQMLSYDALGERNEHEDSFDPADWEAAFEKNQGMPWIGKTENDKWQDARLILSLDRSQKGVGSGKYYNAKLTKAAISKRGSTIAVTSLGQVIGYSKSSKAQGYVANDLLPAAISAGGRWAAVPKGGILPELFSVYGFTPFATSKEGDVVYMVYDGNAMVLADKEPPAKKISYDEAQSFVIFRQLFSNRHFLEPHFLGTEFKPLEFEGEEWPLQPEIRDLENTERLERFVERTQVPGMIKHSDVSWDIADKKLRVVTNDDSILFTHGAAGLYSPKDHVMQVVSRATVADDYQQQVYRHELIHAIFGAAGFNNNPERFFRDNQMMSKKIDKWISLIEANYGKIDTEKTKEGYRIKRHIMGAEFARMIVERLAYGTLSEFAKNDTHSKPLAELAKEVDEYINKNILGFSASPMISDVFLSVREMLMSIDPQAQIVKVAAQEAKTSLHKAYLESLTEAMRNPIEYSVDALRAKEAVTPEYIAYHPEKQALYVATAAMRAVQDHMRENNFAEMDSLIALEQARKYDELTEDYHQIANPTSVEGAVLANLEINPQLGEQIAYSGFSFADPLVTLGQMHGANVVSWASTQNSAGITADKLVIRLGNKHEETTELSYAKSEESIDRERIRRSRHAFYVKQQIEAFFSQNPETHKTAYVVTETSIKHGTAKSIFSNSVGSGRQTPRGVVDLGSTRLGLQSISNQIKKLSVVGPHENKTVTIAEYSPDVQRDEKKPLQDSLEIVSPEAHAKKHSAKKQISVMASPPADRINDAGLPLLKNQEKLDSGEIMSHQDVSKIISKYNFNPDEDSLLQYDKHYDYDNMRPKSKKFALPAPLTPRQRLFKMFDEYFKKWLNAKRKRFIDRIKDKLKMFRLYKEIPEREMPGWMRRLGDWFTQHEDDGINYSTAKEVLRGMKQSAANGVSEAISKIKYVLTDPTEGDLTEMEHEIFSMYLVHANAYDEYVKGNGLHWYDTAEELETAHAVLADRVNSDSRLLEALARRSRMVRQTILRMYETGVLDKKQWLNFDEINPTTGKKYYETWFHQEVFDTLARSSAFKTRLNLGRDTPGDVSDTAKRPEEFDYITNYIAAEYHWLTIAETRANHAESMQEMNQLYGKLDDLKQIAAEELGNEALWHQIFEETNIPGTDKPWKDVYGIKSIKESLAQWLGGEYGETEARQILEEIANLMPYSEEGTLRDIIESLGARLGEVMVLPRPIIDQIELMQEEAIKAAEKGVGFIEKSRSAIKEWLLQRPQGVIGYNLRNLFGDSDFTVASQPGIFKYIRPAFKLMYEYEFKGVPNPLIETASKFGAIDNSMIEHEAETIDKVKEFKKYLYRITESQNSFLKMIKAPTKLYRSYMRAASTVAHFRENVFRMAGFMYFRENSEKFIDEIDGYTFGGTNKNEAKAVYKDLGEDRFAARMSRDHFGDYHSTTLATQTVSNYVLPFFKYTELISRRYFNLVDNYIYELRKPDWRSGTEAMRGMLIGGLFMSKILFWHYLVSGVSKMLMHFYGDDDDNPSHYNQYDKESLGVRIAKDTDGNILLMRNITASGDLMSWAGFTEYEKHEKLSDQVYGFSDHVASKIYASLYPHWKIALETTTGQSFSPDFSNPRKSDVSEIIANNLGLRDTFRELSGRLFGTGKSASPGSLEAFLTGKNEAWGFGKVIGTTNARWNNYNNVRGKYWRKTQEDPNQSISKRPAFKEMFRSAFFNDRNGFDTAWDAYRNNAKHPGDYSTFADQMEYKEVLGKQGTAQERRDYISSLSGQDAEDFREAESDLHDTKTRMELWYKDNLEKLGENGQGIKLRNEKIGILANRLTETMSEKNRKTIAKGFRQLSEQMKVTEEEAADALRTKLISRDRPMSPAARRGAERRFRANWRKMEKQQ